MNELFAANWKEHKTDEEAISYFGRICSLETNKDVVVCPSFVSLSSASRILMDTCVSIGCQDVSLYEHGPYTGEVSAFMLKAFCTYAIIGHSERREHFHENDYIVNQKIKNALLHGLKPILCIGENSAQHKNNRTFSVLWSQLKSSLKNITEEEMKNIAVAYEPVWAISKGDSKHKAADPQSIQETHEFISKQLTKLFGEQVAKETRIIYGGSVKPDNISGFMSQADINGALVGGASLDAESFASIVNYG